MQAIVRKGIMSVDEGARFRLFESAQRQLGHDEAITLMEMLPPVEWSDVATKADLGVLSSELRAEMSQLRGELRAEMAELRGELRTEIADRSSSTVRTIVLAMVANNAAVFGLAFAAVRLAG